MTIVGMQNPENFVWSPGSMAKLAILFKKSYKLAYPSPSSFSSGSSGSGSIQLVSASASVFRRGNESDSEPWTKHCHKMKNIPIVHVVKSTANDVLL
jgi:hypothetical protein